VSQFGGGLMWFFTFHEYLYVPTKFLIMKKLTLFLALATLLFSCTENHPQGDQGEVLTRSDQTENLDRFEAEIKAFEYADSQQMPPTGAILFTGSSSIRMWETLAEDFAPLPVINRGFGGSTLPEVMHYSKRIIYKYEPKLIVLYCGENDIAEGDPATKVFQDFKKFIGETEKNLAGVPIVFISAKPSPDRWKLWRQYVQFNELAERFATARPNVHYVDISGTLLGKNGEPDASLFIQDGLHMNRRGYAKWVEVLQPFLEELYLGKTES
jgi:lysophospholipase L1-like esterase